MDAIDIIIVNYKVPLFVEQLLYSIRSAKTEKLFLNVWVVDNHSEDNSLPYLKKKFPEVNFIANPRNGGFAEANNIAIKASSSPYVLLLNPDTIIGETTLIDCLNEIKKYTNCGAIGGKLIDAHGNFLPECRRGRVSLWSTFCRLSGLSKIFPNNILFNQYYLGYLDKDTSCEVQVLCGAFIFMKREALEKVGLLDERYFMYGEDVDLCYAIRKIGYSIRYIPTPILHYKGESESAAYNPIRYAQAFYGAMSLFYDKYHSKRLLSRHLIRFLLNQKIKKARNKPIKQHKKNIEKLSYEGGKIYSIDLEQYSCCIPRNIIQMIDEIPNGSYIKVKPNPGYYDTLLFILNLCNSKDITLLTEYPLLSTDGLQPIIPLVKDFIIAPGGIFL